MLRIPRENSPFSNIRNWSRDAFFPKASSLLYVNSRHLCGIYRFSKYQYSHSSTMLFSFQSTINVITQTVLHNSSLAFPVNFNIRSVFHTTSDCFFFWPKWNTTKNCIICFIMCYAESLNCVVMMFSEKGTSDHIF